MAGVLSWNINIISSHFPQRNVNTISVICCNLIASEGWAKTVCGVTPNVCFPQIMVHNAVDQLSYVST